MLVDRELSVRQACHGKILMLFCEKSSGVFLSRICPSLARQDRKIDCRQGVKELRFVRVFFGTNKRKERFEQQDKVARTGRYE